MFLCIGVFLTYAHTKMPNEINDESFSFEVKPTATSEFINIVTNRPNQSITIKVIDKAGFIRIQKDLHLDRVLDVSELREGFYLIKVYSENDMAIKRFYKGQDAVNNK